jgi:hypothetical protein
MDIDSSHYQVILRHDQKFLFAFCTAVFTPKLLKLGLVRPKHDASDLHKGVQQLTGRESLETALVTNRHICEPNRR